MKNTDLPITASHPQTTELDRLRAGLLDDDHAARATLLQHLQACGACRARLADWDTLREAAATTHDPHLNHELRARRAAALAGQASGRTTTTHWPRYAVAASLAIAIGVGVFLQLEALQPEIPAEMNIAQSDAVPDVYADIDFYLWLANQPATDDSEADRS